MKPLGLILALGALLVSGMAQAHETGAYHVHAGAAGHQVFGVDHLIVLLAAAVAIGSLFWRSR